MTWARTGPGGVYPIYWYTGNIFSKSLHGLFGNWNRFMAGVPIANGRYADAAATASVSALRVLGQKDVTAGLAHLWIDNRNHTWRAVVNGTAVASATGTVRVTMGAAGSVYTASWYDTRTGLVTSTQQVTANGAGEVVLAVTNLATDTAVRIAKN
jgi:hypothetical protein